MGRDSVGKVVDMRSEPVRTCTWRCIGMERSELSPKLWRWLGKSPERRMQGELLLAWPEPWRGFSEHTTTPGGGLRL